MKVILRENIKELGEKFSIVKVKDGYARNFLIPKGLAMPVTPGNLKHLEHEKKVMLEKLKREEIKAEKVKEKLHKINLVLTYKAGESGKLFGSVTNREIAEGIKQISGVEIDKKNIELPEPIKYLGVYHVPVKLHARVKASVVVQVERDGKAIPEPEKEEDAKSAATTDAVTTEEGKAEGSEEENES